MKITNHKFDDHWYSLSGDAFFVALTTGAKESGWVSRRYLTML